MRSKAPLTLIEQAVMLLVFALAAVLCLKAFVWADTQSAAGAQRDRALLAAQNAAETLKYCEGDFEQAAQIGGGMWDGESWIVLYDEDWNVIDDMHTYSLHAVSGESGLDLLGQATVTVHQDELELAALQICWQEVGGHG